ncbi:hypothetical protein ACTHPF_18880 [Paenibacillus sp. SAF-054]|uniref:hypothetical protein n=1 Tax=Paenibacillus sp. SAFN-054 TaxID=3436865 RepID=UPI003F7CD553
MSGIWIQHLLLTLAAIQGLPMGRCRHRTVRYGTKSGVCRLSGCCGFRVKWMAVDHPQVKVFTSERTNYRNRIIWMKKGER